MDKRVCIITNSIYMKRGVQSSHLPMSPLFLSFFLSLSFSVLLCDIVSFGMIRPRPLVASNTYTHAQTEDQTYRRVH